MRKKTSHSTRELQRIAALPFNPFFQEDVKQIRKRYQITPGIDAYEWFLRERMKYHKSVYSFFISDKKSFFRYTKAKNVLDTDIPLELDILLVISRYDIPISSFEGVLLFILTDNRIWLDSILRPEVKVITDSQRGEVLLNITISNVHSSFSKKEWNAIWEDQIKLQLISLKKAYSIEFGTLSPGKKRSSVESYREQMQRWSEWYKLSEIDRLGPTNALAKWLDDHKDKLTQYDKYDVSTVTHAIQEFREIITPKKM